MPYASREAERAYQRKRYRERAVDPEFRAKRALASRKNISAYTPEKREAYLERYRGYDRAARKDPKERAKHQARLARNYRAIKADPDRLRHFRMRAHAFYMKTRAWQLAQRAKPRAIRKGREFCLTKEWADAAWTGRCAVTGIPFKLDSTVLGPFSPSIDRLDNAVGYTPANCRFVLYAINTAKGAGTDADLLLIARALVKALDR